MLILRQLRSPGGRIEGPEFFREMKTGALRGPLLPLSPKWSHLRL